MSDLPPGFVLEDNSQSSGGLPAGFMLEEPQQDSGFLSSLETGLDTGGRALLHGFYGIGSAVGAGVESLGDAVQGLDSFSRREGGTPLGGLGRMISDAGEYVRQGGQDIQEQIRPKDMEPGTAQSIGFNAISGLTQAAPVLISTGPLAGSLLLGGASGAQKYTELKDRGVDKGEAGLYGAGVGAANTALNLLPLGLTAKEGMPLLNRLMLGAVTDSATSAVGTALDQGATKLATGDQWTPQDTANIGESALTNALTGIGIGAVQHAKENYTAKSRKAEIDRIMQGLREEQQAPEVLGLPAPPEQQQLPAPPERLGLPAPEGVSGGDGFIAQDDVPHHSIEAYKQYLARLKAQQTVENAPEKSQSAEGILIGGDVPAPAPDIVLPGQTPENPNASIVLPEGLPSVPSRQVSVEDMLLGNGYRERKQAEAAAARQQEPSRVVEGPPSYTPREEVPTQPQQAQEPTQQLADIPAPTEQPDLFNPQRPTSRVEGYPPVSIPVKDLQLSKDVPQWKSNANEKGIVTELKGGFDERDVGPIQVWQRNDGRLEVISGRHRLDLAQRTGKESLWAQVHREADGFTQRDASILDAELNIRDGNGEINDYANYFKHSGLGEEEAISRGLLNSNKGVLGYDIGTKATPDVYALYQDGRITDRQAASIARVAPGNDALQQVGVKAVLKGLSTEHAVNQMRALESDYGSLPPSEQGSLFGSDDRAIRLAEAQAKIVTKMQKDIAADIESARGSAKRPENAEKMGVKVKDVESTKQKLQALEAEKARLDRWYMDDELKAKVKAEAMAEEGSSIATKFNKVRASQSAEGGFINIGDLLGKNRDIPVEGLKDSQSFLEGRIGGRYIPGLSEGLAAIRGISFDKTLADKYPHIRDAYYKGGRTLIEDANTTASELSDAFRGYFSLKDKSRVDPLLAEFALEAKRNKLAKKPVFNPTDKALAAKGLTPEEISAIRSHQKGVDLSLNHLQEALLEKAKGVQGAELQKKYVEDVKDYIKSLRDTNYVPFRRYGDGYTVIAKDKDGNTIWRSQHNSKAEARAEAAAQIKLGKDAKVATIPKSDADAYGSFELPSNLVDRVNQLSPETWIKARELQKFKPDKGGPHGFNRHMQRAQGIEGYDKNITKATADYVLGLANFKAKSKAIPEIQRVINSLDPKTEPLLKGNLERYKEGLSKGTHPVAAVAKRTVNALTLAGVPSSAFINATQSIVTTMPHMVSELAKTTGAFRAGREMPRIGAAAARDAFSFMSDRLRGKDSLGTRNPELAKDLNRAVKAGVVGSEGMDELFAIKKKADGKSSLSDKAMFMFGAAETGNRLYAFISGREIGLRKGLKGDALFDYAKKFVSDTQFDTSKANQNWLTRSAVGSVATQYKGFAANYLRFLRNHTAPGERLGLALSLGVTWGLGGAIGLPYVKQIESIAESLGFNARTAWKKFTKDADWAHAVMYGLPTYAGTNLSGFVSTGEFLPGIDMDPKTAALNAIGGPLAGYVPKLAKAYDIYSKKENPWVAAETIAPRGLRGPLKAARIIRDGELTDADGKPLIKDPTRWETAQIAMGFAPDRLGREYERKAEVSDLKKADAHRDKDYNMLLAKYLSKGDQDGVKRIINEMVAAGIKPDMSAVKPHMAGYVDPRLEEILRAPKKLRPALMDSQQRGSPR